MKAQTVQAILPALISRLTTDLAQSIGCRWALAFSSLDTLANPPFIFGNGFDLNGFDLNRSIAHISRTLPVGGAFAARGSCFWNSSARLLSDPVCVVSASLSECPCTLVFGPKNDGSVFTSDERALLEGVSSHLADIATDDRFALIVAGRMAAMEHAESDLLAARETENRLFPHALPAVDGLDYYGECRPTGAVGGDFFDFVRGGDSALSVSIGDVSGKGVSAAIITAGLQASLRALAPSTRKLTSLIQDLNRMVWEISPTGFFATMFFGIFDLARREMHYVNAGHQPPLLIRANRDRIIRLDPSGSVLGLSAGSSFRQQTVSLEPGDLFLASTDGVNEDCCEQCFENHILEIVRDHSASPAIDLARRILQMPQPSEEPRIADDRTVVVVQVKDSGGSYLVAEERELCFTACAA